MMYPQLKTRNIKISFFINRSINLEEKMLIVSIDINSFLNNISSSTADELFDVIKITIYKHTPYLINVTGIRSFKKLKKVKKIIETLFSCKIIKQRIDAIMQNFKSKYHMKINLGEFLKVCQDNPIIKSSYRIDYNPELFNAPYLKSTNGKGTILIFSNGSVQVLGCKKREFLKDNQKLIKIIFSQYYQKKQEKILLIDHLIC